MKKQFSKIAAIIGIATCSISLMVSCSSNEPTLGAIPKANFTFQELTPKSDSLPQNIILVNTTSPKGIAYWNIKGIGTFIGDTVRATAVFKGTYEVDLFVTAQGGLTDTLKQNIVISKDNPLAISPTSLLNVMTNATGTGSKVWYAPRVLDVCVVGPDIQTNLAAIAAGGGAWWGFGPGEITTDGSGRDGYLDDSYTFFFGPDFKFTYDDKGTCFLDAGGSGWTGALVGNTVTASFSKPIGTPYSQALGNYMTADVYAANPALKPWGPGTYSYSLVPGAGAMGLGQITVNGIGAHFGLQDKTEHGDVKSPTVKSVTYDVQKINLNVSNPSGGTYDQIIIGVNSGGVCWSFVFRSNH
ncbi:MAG: hypothetical protein P4L34_01745 [Paludibacter sp.]|nr:hypothetical protein [Paludibacter sp.]